MVVKRLFTKGFSVTGVYEGQASPTSGLPLASQSPPAVNSVAFVSSPGGVVQSSFVKDDVVSYDTGKYQALTSHFALPQASSSGKSSSTVVASLLDHSVPKSNFSSGSSKKLYKGAWSRKQKRGYQRIRSITTYWREAGYEMSWLMFSTAAGGDASKLAGDHQRIKQAVERHFNFPNIQHFMVQTEEGNGVLHVLWAWRAPKGFRPVSFYVPHAWLSKRWERIHGAKVVWISKVTQTKKSLQRVSHYCISQYVAGQAGYVRMSWSWWRMFGFPLVGAWYLFKKWGLWGGNYFNYSYSKWRYKAFLSLWDDFLSGLSVKLGRCEVSMDFFRTCYVDYGANHWRDMLQALAQGCCYIRKLNK